MSGASGRRVGQKVFDWVKISSRIPEEVRPQFNAFRSRHEANKARQVGCLSWCALTGVNSHNNIIYTT